GLRRRPPRRAPTVRLRALSAPAGDRRRPGRPRCPRIQGGSVIANETWFTQTFTSVDDAPHEFLASVLDQTVSFIRRYVVLRARGADAAARWTAPPYAFSCATATPYLHPYSPEPGSGKTPLLEVLEAVAKNAILADGVSEAVLFRMIHSLNPTLLFD